jgi:lantibiotic modifying enzyme
MRRTESRGIRIVSAAAVFLVLLAGAKTPTETYFETALGAARWLDSVALKTETGTTWPADPKDPTTVNDTLYSGAPGVVLFYLEARAAALAAGREDEAAAFLEKAKSGADDLLAHLSRATGVGLYEGIAGVGFALEEVYKATSITRFRQGFARCLTNIRARAVQTGKGAEWSPVTDIIGGAAGTGLFLLYAAEEIGDRSLNALAASVGDRLIELGRAKSGGLDWAMDPSFPRLMPNFSHGTAGVAFFLTRLSVRTGKKEYLDAALAGARYLLSIAKTDGDGCLIFHHEPDGKDLYYLGWCHGPVGTANLFYELFKVTGDKTWRDWVLKQARSLMNSGIPEKETPGFWNNAGICCGLAGVADFFLSLHRVTKDARYLEYGRRVLVRLSAQAATEENRKRWIQAEHRTQPKLLIAQTGLMQGAAGIGLVFLRWDAFVKGRSPRINLPDSAF